MAASNQYEIEQKRLALATKRAQEIMNTRKLVDQIGGQTTKETP